jgi:hypothetical protein
MPAGAGPSPRWTRCSTPARPEAAGHAREGVVHEQDRRAAVLQDEGDLRRREAGVDGHEDGARHGDGEQELEVAVAVQGQDRDAVAPADPEAGEAAGQRATRSAVSAQPRRRPRNTVAVPKGLIVAARLRAWARCMGTLRFGRCWASGFPAGRSRRASGGQHTHRRRRAAPAPRFRARPAPSPATLGDTRSRSPARAPPVHLVGSAAAEVHEIGEEDRGLASTGIRLASATRPLPAAGALPRPAKPERPAVAGPTAAAAGGRRGRIAQHANGGPRHGGADVARTRR